MRMGVYPKTKPRSRFTNPSGIGKPDFARSVAPRLHVALPASRKAVWLRALLGVFVVFNFVTYLVVPNEAWLGVGISFGDLAFTEFTPFNQYLAYQAAFR